MKYLIDFSNPSIRLSLMLTVKIIFSPIFLIINLFKISIKHARLIKQGRWEDLFAPNSERIDSDSKTQQKTFGNDSERENFNF